MSFVFCSPTNTFAKKKTKEPLFLGDVKLEYVDKLFRILFAWKNFCEYPALSLPSLQAI